MRSWPRIAALAALTALAAAGAAARDCAVTGMEGRAELWRAGVWRAVETGPLPAAELKLRTARASRVRIACDDGLVVTVAAGAEVNLDSVTGRGDGARDVVIQLIRGLIGLWAPERRWRRLEVRTPLAIASARQTRWLVEAPEPGGAAVFVAEGAVAVRPAARGGFPTAILRAGEGVTVAPDGSRGPVVAWGAPRIDAARAALGFGWR